jgi:hypothetical protein
MKNTMELAFEKGLHVTPHNIERLQDLKGAGTLRIKAYDFLQLTTPKPVPLWIKEEEEAKEVHTLDQYNSWQAKGLMPWLSIDMHTGRVIGHEGRHRAAALIREHGIESHMDIGIVLYDKTYPLYYRSDENWKKTYVTWKDVPTKLHGEFRPTSVRIYEDDFTPFYKAEASVVARVEVADYVPEWEKPCWIVGITKTLGVTDAKVKKLALKNEWDGVSTGLAIKSVLLIVWDLIGHMPDLSLTKDAKGMTARQFSGKTTARGLVFTKAHVMPMVRGQVSNFNGHGEEQVVAVASY